jgi:glycosyltransferase involved in cell wall biosynthesis
MRLDVIVPTHNRAALLARTLESLLAADPAESLDVRVTVVDNRSTDDTRATVESFRDRFAGRLQYVFESQAGRSHALNAGIERTNGDLVGMIDDDEEVDRTWLTCIENAFRDPATDFVGGPYVPRWGAEQPAWLGASYRAAVGWVDGGPEVRQYGPDFGGMLMGGNAVIRRTLLARVGPYAADLGRTSTRLMSCEDEDMFKRLLAAGGRGYYRPDLIIHHYVPPERLRRGYFRSWCFWHGVSLGLLDRRQPQPVPYVLGVPRYMFGSALRGVMDTAKQLFGQRRPDQVFSNELAWWDLAGFFYGKHRYRTRSS